MTHYNGIIKKKKLFTKRLHPQIIDECVLCVHGGLSPDIKTIDQIRTIERNQEIPHKGAFCDILFLYLADKILIN